MIDLIKTFIYQYLDLVIVVTASDLIKLIDVVDPIVLIQGKVFRTDIEHLLDYKALPPVSDTDEDEILEYFIWHWFELFRQTELNASLLSLKYFLDLMNNSSFLIKLMYVFNTFLVKLLFFKITPLTFWLVPIFLMFIFGIGLLFFIKPNGLNLHIWSKAKVFMIIIFFYQIMLISLFLYFFSSGLLLKVGYSLAFTSSYNIQLVKLFFQLCITSCLIITIFFFFDFYKKNLLIIKPELVIILFFLGFGSDMVFLQNDLFSMFLYFEIISFCIYGLLFLQKWTNAQLHALVWYVLFSLWISTCYIFGTAFYIAASNTSTNLSYFWGVTPRLVVNADVIGPTPSPLALDYFLNIENMTLSFFELLKSDFEFILALTFLLIYFLFKLGVGPFYTWTIEVYNACPTNTLLPVSLLPKLIYFPMLFFILFFCFIEYWVYWSSLLIAVGTFTIFIGSFGILLTDKLKEIYAWSSIIHSGNLLVLVSCLANSTLALLTFYLFSYYLVSIGFIILMISLQNRYTGWLIKTINELGSLNLLNSSFCLTTTILLASAAGFTPFVSFFMKFSLLSVTIGSYSIGLVLIIGLLNIIGSVAYLRMLWNIIGFNANLFWTWFRNFTLHYIELKISYWIALLFNLLVIFIIFGFVFFLEFNVIFQYYAFPIYIGENNFELLVSRYKPSYWLLSPYLDIIKPFLYDISWVGSKGGKFDLEGGIPQRNYCDPRFTDQASMNLCEWSKQWQAFLDDVNWKIMFEKWHMVLWSDMKNGFPDPVMEHIYKTLLSQAFSECEGCLDHDLARIDQAKSIAPPVN